jgi:hypothetical protein
MSSDTDLLEKPSPASQAEELPPGIKNWETWAVSAAGAFLGAPYLESGTAHAAWAGFVHSLRIRLTR